MNLTITNKRTCRSLYQRFIFLVRGGFLIYEYLELSKVSKQKKKVTNLATAIYCIELLFNYSHYLPIQHVMDFTFLCCLNLT